MKNWPLHERPREKLLYQGSKTLSDSELLAIFLRTGTKESNVIELAQRLLKHFGSLNGLFAADLQSFCRFKGLGTAKYVQLQASLELTQRYLKEPLEAGLAIENPDHVKQFLLAKMKSHLNEVFAVIFLDNQHRIIQFEELFFGTINASSVHPRVVVQRALALNAAAIIISHNHPSGVAEPSSCDIDMTKTLKRAMALVDIRLLDHIIIAAHRAISLAENGQL